MRVAITGSRGFIGSYLKNALIDNHEVIEWDLRIDKDIKDFNTNGIDFVVHLAAAADVRASIEDPKFYWQNNVVNTTKIQKLCHENEIPLLYASSSCIHNWWLSPYGISKKVNEETAYPNQVGLRFTTVYGAGARDSMFIGRLIKGKIEYFTNHIRDFIHVNDVTDVILLLMGKDIATLKPAYDIGTGKGNYVYELGHILGYEDLPIKDGDPCEAKDNTANIQALRAFDWEPTIDVVRYL